MARSLNGSVNQLSFSILLNNIGGNAHPFFKWASKNHGRSAIPKWNFHKIIIGKDGKVADTFLSTTKPSSRKFISLIEKEIKN